MTQSLLAMHSEGWCTVIQHFRTVMDESYSLVQPSRYQDQPLISLHGLEHPTERLKPFVVAVLTTLPPGPLGDQALRSTQTAVQHLSTTAGLGKPFE